MSNSDLCSYPGWYERLPSKRRIASVWISLSTQMVSYLLDPGPLVLPRECYPNDSRDTEVKREKSLPSFPEMSKQISSAIAFLGGSVVCKLNSVSPLDAVWISEGQFLKCCSLKDIFLLLKASDKVRDELKSLTCCTKNYSVADLASRPVATSMSPLQPLLILKRWYPEMNVNTEYRCFLAEGRLVAACCRDAYSYVSHILLHHDDIAQALQRITETDLLPLISSGFPVPSRCEVDIWLPASLYNKQIVPYRVIDFFPQWRCNRTDPLLFIWEELEFRANKINCSFEKNSQKVDQLSQNMVQSSVKSDSFSQTCDSENQSPDINFQKSSVCPQIVTNSLVEPQSKCEAHNFSLDPNSDVADCGPLRYVTKSSVFESPRPAGSQLNSVPFDATVSGGVDVSALIEMMKKSELESKQSDSCSSIDSD